MSFYSEPDSYIKDKDKIFLDLPNYVPKKKLNDAADVDRTN